jgi:hypothetical protein
LLSANSQSCHALSRSWSMRSLSLVFAAIERARVNRTFARKVVDMIMAQLMAGYREQLRRGLLSKASGCSHPSKTRRLRNCFAIDGKRGAGV